MTCRGNRCRVERWAVVAAVVAAALPALGGPWSELPEAVGRLGQRPDDIDAARVLRRVEVSVIEEAQRGRVVAARQLFDTYASLVSELPDSGGRLTEVERRMAAGLLAVGDRAVAQNLGRAVQAWALAAELLPSSAASDRLRDVLLPPADAEPGEVWRAPLDGAVLVFHPAATIRLGCTDGDGDCLGDELIFRWIEVPALWVESTEVTNRRYRLCVEAGACTPPVDASRYGDGGRDREPVVGVSWLQARTFARWAGRRLPSEAEWERAARGEVTEARFPWGDGRRRGLANVWRDPTRFGEPAKLLPAASFPPTGYGLWDVAGNVWEWCQDRYRSRFADAVLTGGAARIGLGRVVRGGSWRRAIDMARVSTRLWYDAGYAADDVGFRCVVDGSPRVALEELTRVARRIVPDPVAPGLELEGAALEPEDRRFLERRAITLLVIEGRLDEALGPAAARLTAEPRDPVALDLLDRFESSVLAAAAAGGPGDIGERLEVYSRASVRTPKLARRFDAFEDRVVARLRRTVSESRAAGADEVALAAARTGRELEPGDAIFAAAATALARRSGTVRVWPQDGKGMVWIASQSFTLGASPGDTAADVDEQPPTEVTVPGFWIDRTEVTNDEYRSCVQAGACSPPVRTDGYDDPRLGKHPVFWVEWNQARAYAAWAGKRLPSEAEWELAARGKAVTPFPWGASWIPGKANAMGVYRQDVWEHSAPVASFEAGWWGVYDLVGNAAEWVEDVYQATIEGMPAEGRARYQETGPAGERRRVVRGGGHDDPPPKQRVSHRSPRRPDHVNRSVGFRCVADD